MMDEVSTAKAAFAFLLGQYVTDNLPTDPASEYLGMMVQQRLTGSAQSQPAGA